MEDPTEMEYRNINGFKLRLQVDESGTPKSITFTIRYKTKKFKITWPRLFLTFVLLLYFATYFQTYVTWCSICTSGIVFASIFVFWATHSVQAESLTVIPTVGLQSSVKYVVGNEHKFVQWSAIDDLIINEVIKMNCVLYSLTVLVRVQPEMECYKGLELVPLFKYTQPRLKMIEKVYAEIREVLKMKIQDLEDASEVLKANSAHWKREQAAGDNDSTYESEMPSADETG